MKNFKLTNGTRSYAIQQIQGMDLNEPKRINIDDWQSKRSLSANALSHVWCAKIGEYIGTDAFTVKCYSKIDQGLPIALFDTQKGVVIDWMLQKLNFYNLTREQQVKIISAIEMTSWFNTSQMRQYMDNLQSFWRDNGLILENE